MYYRNNSLFTLILVDAKHSLTYAETFGAAILSGSEPPMSRVTIRPSSIALTFLIRISASDLFSCQKPNCSTFNRLLLVASRISNGF